MQIYHTFTCRECGQDQTIRTDTADYGDLNGPHLAQGDHQYHEGLRVAAALPVRPCLRRAWAGLRVLGGTPAEP